MIPFLNNMKKILSLAVLISFFMVLTAQAAFAGTDPKILFSLDCNTMEKKVSIGLVSNADQPGAGQEISAAKLYLVISPVTGTSFDDIKLAKLAQNMSLLNLLVAENRSDAVGNTIEIKTTIGFTGTTAPREVKDIFTITGISGKPYQIDVKSAEIYGKTSNTNLYKGPLERFTADPATCATVTPTGNQTTIPPTAATSITLSADKASGVKKGDKVTVTAIVMNRKGAGLDWTQTKGSQISPDIKNEDLDATKTKSTLTFIMPETFDEIVINLKAGSVTEKINIAPEKVGGVEPTPAVTPPPSPSTDTLDRLRSRRLEQDPAEPQNVHASADTLTQSGPAETGIILSLITIVVMILFRKRKQRSL